MIEYAIVFVIIIIGALFFDNNCNVIIKRKWIRVEWLSLVLLAGLRYKVGGDTQWYYESYQTSPTLFDLSIEDFISGYNVLWVILTSLCKTISSNFVVFQLVHAVIVNTAVFYFLKKYSSRFFLSILIYFILFYIRYNMEILRAALAVSVFLWSYQYLEKRKWGYFYLYALIALGFHTEAIIVFIFPVLYKIGSIKINARNLLLFISITILLLLVNFIPFLQFVSSSSQSMSSGVEFYADQSELGKGVTLLGYLKTICINLVWIVFLLLLKGDKYILFRGFAFFCFFICLQSLNYSNIFYRAQDFTNLIFVVCACLTIQISRRQKLFLHQSIIYFALIFMSVDYMVYLASHFILYYPYETVFNPVDYIEREEFFNAIFHQ